MTERHLVGPSGDADDWDRHWSDYNPAVEKNPAQAFRRRLIMRLLDRSGAPDRVLDIGSGQGDLAAELTKRHPDADVLGLEYSRSGVEISRSKAPSASFLQRDLLTEREAPERYRGWATHAVCSEVLEHVDEPVVLLRNARTFLAPGCRLIVTVPGGPMSAFDRHIGHRRHFSPSSLASVLTGAGFEVEHCFGAGFPFFNLYRLTVIARGRRLSDDVRSDAGGSPAARVAMRMFDGLLHATRMSGPWGWQTVGVAHLPPRVEARC